MTETIIRVPGKFIADEYGTKLANLSDINDDVSNRPYDPSGFSGMGRKYLEKNIVGNKNILTQGAVSDTNTVYVIQYDFDLNDQEIEIPENCILEFAGGSINGGTLELNNTYLYGNVRFGTGITINGTCKNDTAYQYWFANNDVDAWHGFINSIDGVVTFEYEEGTYTATVLVDKEVDKQIIINGNGATVTFPLIDAGHDESYKIAPENNEELTTRLTAALSKGDTEISVESLDGIAIGDICALHDHATSSYNSMRDYEQGEFFFVRDIVDGKIIPDHAIYGNYSHISDDEPYTEDDKQMHTGPCTLTKFHTIDVRIQDITFKQRQAVGQTGSHCLRVNKAKAELENVYVYDFVVGIRLSNCLNSFVRNCESISNKEVYSGIDSYGILISNSQEIEIEGGRYMAGNHGIACGGHYRGDMSIVNRFHKIHGVTANSNKFVYGINAHGQTDHLWIYKNSTNGIAVSGDHLYIEDNIVTGDINISTNLSYNHRIVNNVATNIELYQANSDSYTHSFDNYTPYQDEELLLIENNKFEYLHVTTELTEVQRPNQQNIRILARNNIITKRVVVTAVPSGYSAYTEGGTVQLSGNDINLASTPCYVRTNKVIAEACTFTGNKSVGFFADKVEISGCNINGGTINICPSDAAPSYCNIQRNTFAGGKIEASPNANSSSSKCIWRVIGNLTNSLVTINCFHDGSTKYDTVLDYSNYSDYGASCLTVNDAAIVRSNADKTDYVDLGLPSGLLWAKYNLGASRESEAGSYFSWGNIDGHVVGDGYSFDSVTYGNTSGGSLSSDIPENATYDAARDSKGGDWRIPTEVEWNELINNCIFEWTDNYNGTGVAGAVFTGNGNTLFLPAGGYIQETSKKSSGICNYWSSTLDDSDKSKRFASSSSLNPTTENGTRAYGELIRAVMSNV